MLLPCQKSYFRVQLFRDSESLEILRNMGVFVVLFLTSQLLIGMTSRLGNSITSQVFDGFSVVFYVVICGHAFLTHFLPSFPAVEPFELDSFMCMTTSISLKMEEGCALFH